MFLLIPFLTTTFLLKLFFVICLFEWRKIGVDWSESYIRCNGKTFFKVGERIHGIERKHVFTWRFFWQPCFSLFLSVSPLSLSPTPIFRYVWYGEKAEVRTFTYVVPVCRVQWMMWRGCCVAMMTSTASCWLKMTGWRRSMSWLTGWLLRATLMLTSQYSVYLPAVCLSTCLSVCLSFCLPTSLPVWMAGLCIMHVQLFLFFTFVSTLKDQVLKFHSATGEP